MGKASRRRHGFLTAGASIALAVHGHIGRRHGGGRHVHAAGLPDTRREPGDDSHREQKHEQPSCEFAPHAAEVAFRSTVRQRHMPATQSSLSPKRVPHGIGLLSMNSQDWALDPLLEEFGTAGGAIATSH